MADRWAVAAGNWSNTATWDGGTLPGAGDDVFADGRAVTIDQNITVLSIRTTQRSGGTAGGSFSISTTRTVNADIIAGTTTCLTSAGNVTLVGNVTGGSATNAAGVSASGAGRYTITGNVTGGTASNAVGMTVASINNSVTGDVTGGSVSGAHGISAPSGVASVTINGQVIAGTAANVHGVSVAAVGGSATINGDLVQSDFASPVLLNNNSASLFVNTVSAHVSNSTFGFVTVTAGTMVFTGTITGGSLTNQICLSVAAAGRVRIIGDVTGGSAAGATAIPVVTTASTTTTVHVIGNVTGGSNATAHGISISLQGSLFIEGNVTGGSLGNAIHYNGSPRIADFVVVVGNVTGGSVSGIGVRASNFSMLYVYGTVTDSGGLAHSAPPDVTSFVTDLSGGGSSSLPLIGPGGLVY